LFFEKKRIAEGKGKSAARLQGEKEERGRKMIKSAVYCLCGVEEECHEDDKGRLIISRTGKVFKL
jgi:hypothetical protein